MDRNVLTHLSELNRSVDTAISILERFSVNPEIDKTHLSAIQAQFREQLADVNLLVLEEFLDIEEKEMGAAFAIRAAYEEKIGDPDDCYFAVANREEERRKQGLPPLIGVLRGIKQDKPANMEQEPSSPNEEAGPES